MRSIVSGHLAGSRLLARHVEHGDLAAAAVGGVEQSIRTKGERARHGQTLRQAHTALPVGETVAEELIRVLSEGATHIEESIANSQRLGTRRHGCQHAQGLAVRGELQNRADIAAGVADIDDPVGGGKAVRTFHLRPAGEPGPFPGPLPTIRDAPFVHTDFFVDNQHPRLCIGGKRGNGRTGNKYDISHGTLCDLFFPVLPRAPPDARDERPVARSPKNRPTIVKNETITLRHVRRRGRARERGKISKGARAMATVYHISVGHGLTFAQRATARNPDLSVEERVKGMI